MGHNWIVEKSSESTVAVSILLLRRVDSPDSVVPVNKAPAPSPPFHYLCVSVWIFCDHPLALSPWLSCIDGDTFLQPEWTDSLWMSLLTYFDPKFRDSGDWAGRYFSPGQRWCHQRVRPHYAAQRYRQTDYHQNTRYAARRKLLLLLCENRILSLCTIVLASKELSWKRFALIPFRTNERIPSQKGCNLII